MFNTSSVHPTLPCRDLEVARAFWVEKLGLREVEANGLAGQVIVEAADGHCIILYESPHVGMNKATACAFEVSDLESEMRDLMRRGIEFEDYDQPDLKTRGGIAELGDGKGAWFQDPDHNIVSVFQPSRVLAHH